MKVQQSQTTKNSAAVLAGVSIVAWLIPIIGLPISIIAIIQSSRSLPAKLSVAALSVSIITLLLAGGNAFLGAIKGYQGDTQKQQAPYVQQDAANGSGSASDSPSGNASGYPFEYGYNFTNSCKANGGSESACSCSLTLMQTYYSYDQAAAFDASGSVPAEFTQRVNELCS